MVSASGSTSNVSWEMAASGLTAVLTSVSNELFPFPLVDFFCLRFTLVLIGTEENSTSLFWHKISRLARAIAQAEWIFPTLARRFARGCAPGLMSA